MPDPPRSSSGVREAAGGRRNGRGLRGGTGRAGISAARLRRVRGGGGGSRVARDVGGGVVSPLAAALARGGSAVALRPRAGGEIKLCNLQPLCRFTHRAVPPISARIQPQQIRQLIRTTDRDLRGVLHGSATGTALWTGYTEGVRAPTRIHHERSIHQAGASRLSIDSEPLHARRCRGREGPKVKKYIPSRDTRRQSAGQFRISGARVGAARRSGRHRYDPHRPSSRLAFTARSAQSG